MLQKTYEAFTVDITDKVAHIKMNRPEAMNTMNKAFWTSPLASRLLRASLP